MKVYWVSRHDLSPAQQSALRSLHGEDVEVIKDPQTFMGAEGLAEYIRQHDDGFVYAVAGAVHYIVAALRGLQFGIFENHPQKRVDGTFGLAAVYWVNYPEWGEITKVWVNPDPMRDEGEPLVPVLR
jgi:hypothetical protein